MADLFLFKFHLANRAASPSKRRKTAFLMATELSDSISDRMHKSAWLSMVVNKLSSKGPDDDEEALHQALVALKTYEKTFPKALKEYYVYGVTDINNQWMRSVRPSDVDRERDAEKSSAGKEKVRHNCDSCGAPLKRVGPARRFGWGLYRCDHCGSEYTIKE